MLKKILVTIANPKSSQYVFEQALTLAKALGANLGLLHVTDPDSISQYQPSYIESLQPYIGERGTESSCYIGHFETHEPELFGALVDQAKAAGVNTECIHCFGDPETIINDFALAWKPDLIVLGRRGRRGLTEFFLGSVSNYLLHHASCSLYVVVEPVESATDNAVAQVEKV